MTTRSARLGGVGVTVSSTSDTTLYTAASDVVALVKRLVVANSGGAARTLNIGVGGTGAGQRLQLQRAVPLEGLDDETWWVLEPGDALAMRASGAGVVVTLFGAELTAP